MMKLLIIIPAHNEEKTIAPVIAEAKHYGTVLVVNDASTDKTAQVARQAGADVISHLVNRGLGAALRTGFEKALSLNVDAVITIDADGQHDPQEISLFISALDEGYDFVLGARNLSKYPFVKKFGNFFLNLATNFISGTHLKDTEGGFRAIRAEALKKMYLKAERYEIAVEIVFEVGRNNLKATNIPVTSPRYVKGVGVWDGVKNFLYLLSRRKRKPKDYIADIKYVFRKQTKQ
ncbi:MAG: glycosyltransferase family 2 protein [Candidatus Aenigmarchaeota archaeon]|nr:glycosyltransferase family 2 protein [Candidatus Aenigmarchaeota archaeon]